MAGGQCGWDLLATTTWVIVWLGYHHVMGVVWLGYHRCMGVVSTGSIQLDVWVSYASLDDHRVYGCRVPWTIVDVRGYPPPPPYWLDISKTVCVCRVGWDPISRLVWFSVLYWLGFQIQNRSEMGSPRVEV